MKTPEKIKKGLECCANDTTMCSERCPYFNSLSNGVDCASKMHDDALAYIQQLEAQVPKWISVEERLPELKTINSCYGERVESVRVLCACKQKSGKRMAKEGYCKVYHGGTLVHWKLPGTIDKITHWMPLPEPPEV